MDQTVNRAASWTTGLRTEYHHNVNSEGIIGVNDHGLHVRGVRFWIQKHTQPSLGGGHAQQRVKA